jgi:membrane-associated protease RseP (regulator of RpoE activity)
MTAALVILAVTALVALTWALCTATAGAFAGAVPTRVHLFAGPALRLGRVRGVDVHLGLLPIGSSVQFLDLELAGDPFDAHEPPEAQTATWLGYRQVFERLPLATRLTVLLIGVAIYFGTLILLLKYDVASAERMTRRCAAAEQC